MSIPSKSVILATRERMPGWQDEPPKPAAGLIVKLYSTLIVIKTVSGKKDLDRQPISSSDNHPMVATFSDGSSNNAAKSLQLGGRMRRESLDRYVNVADLVETR